MLKISWIIFGPFITKPVYIWTSPAPALTFALKSCFEITPPTPIIGILFDRELIYDIFSVLLFINGAPETPPSIVLKLSCIRFDLSMDVLVAIIPVIDESLINFKIFLTLSLFSSGDILIKIGLEIFKSFDFVSIYSISSFK